MGTRLVVINDTFGGFWVDRTVRKKMESVARCFGLMDADFFGHFSDYDLRRDNPILVYAVQIMGKHHKAKGHHPEYWTYDSLKMIHIPDDIEWEIGEHDGKEWVAEKHRTWY